MEEVESKKVVYCIIPSILLSGKGNKTKQNIS